MDLPVEVQTLMIEIRALVQTKFERARVQPKVNAKGDLVIGVIIPPREPGEWVSPRVDAREAKRLARERR
jgi:hypothetical protein